MKKLQLFFLILCSFPAFAQKNSVGSFEGVIAYTISIDGNVFPKEIVAIFNGSDAKTFIKGEHRRVDIHMAMQNSSTIINTTSNTSVTLMDFMDQKYLIRSTAEDIKKEENNLSEPTYNYTNETKVIAGYTCKKVEVSMKVNGKDETFNVYVTDQIPYIDYKNVYKGLKGFPLEYTISQSGIEITSTAVTISTEKVSDSKFDIPQSGYTEFTYDSFKKEMEKFGAQ